MYIKPFNKNSDKNRIYHYCKLKTAIKYILPSLRLRISPMLNTNDPRENKSFVFSGITDDKKGIDNIWENNEEISKILRTDCKVLCFCEDTQDGKFGYELSRMWALYGDNHKGVCLELDKQIFIEENNIDTKFFKRINYVEDFTPDFEKYKKIDYDEMRNHGKEKYLHETFRISNLNYLYFTKDKEWESENEIRVIRFSKNKCDEFYSIKKSLRNIFLGVDLQKRELVKVTKVCQISDIKQLRYLNSRMIPK